MFLGKYEVLGQLGVGGFGRVLLARDPEKEDTESRLVAIKRLRRAKAQQPQVRKAIEHEAELGRYLLHPNIVRIIELSQDDTDLLLVMEFINGIGLDELLSHQRMKLCVISPAVALEVAIQAGRGLHFAHCARDENGKALGVVHRDVKPSNIMIDRDGVVRIMDFGVALASIRTVHTTTGTIKGTLRYLSPEQANGGRDIGPKADQFALGLVLGEMILGRPVYDAARDHQILLKAMRGDVVSTVDAATTKFPAIGRILERTLSRSRRDRFPSVGRVVSQLEAVVSESEFAPVSLAEVVHHGLEERARLALEEPDFFGRSRGTSSHRAALDIAEVSRGSARSDANSAHALGWAHEQLSALDSPETEEVGDEGAGWKLVSIRSASSVELKRDSRLPADLESWALVSSSESKEIRCLDDDASEVLDPYARDGDPDSQIDGIEFGAEGAPEGPYELGESDQILVLPTDPQRRSVRDTTTIRLVVDAPGEWREVDGASGNPDDMADEGTPPSDTGGRRRLETPKST